MDFEFNEEQKSIRALIKEFCEREVDIKRLQEIADKAAIARSAQEIRENMPWDLLEKLHDVGLRQLAVPEKYGGGGVGFMTRAVAAEAAGYYGGPLDRLLTINWKHCEDIKNLCSEEQHERFFTHFMTDHKAFLAGAISEPQGTTEISMPFDEPGEGAGTRTFAHKDGNEWVINGDKMFCSGGAVATLIVVLARTDKHGTQKQSTSQFWVNSDTPGIEFEVNRLIGGDITGNVQMHLTDVRVPNSNLIGKPNEAMRNVNVIPGGKAIHFYGLLGISQRLFEHMVEYAKERIQSGKPIIQHPNIAAKISEAAVNLEATRALLYRGAWEYQKWEESPSTTLVSPLWGHFTNYFWKNMALRLCEIADDVYGGMAAVKEMPLDPFVRYLYGMLHGGQTGEMNLIKAAQFV